MTNKTLLSVLSAVLRRSLLCMYYPSVAIAHNVESNIAVIYQNLYKDCFTLHGFIKTSVTYSYYVYSRDPPIMLIILPIMLCCTAQKFTYYA